MEPVARQEEHSFGSGDDMLRCCLCSRLLRDPAQLQCLHNCCRPCLDRAIVEGSSNMVTCSACQQPTDVNAVKRNYFLEVQTHRYRTLNEPKLCVVCEENGSCDSPAIAWCESCKKTLCTDCVPAHSRMNRSHVTVSLDDDIPCHLGNAVESSCPQCLRHKQPAEFACLTCKATECMDCWLQCLQKEHDAQHRYHPSVQGHLRLLRDEIARLCDALLIKSSAVCERGELRKALKVARERHLNELKQRKRDVIAAVDMSYQAAETAVKELYDSLDGKAAGVNQHEARILQKISHAVSYCRTISCASIACELLNQQELLTNQMNSLLSELATVEDHSLASSTVVIDFELPENLDEVLSSWIGTPKIDAGLQSAEPVQPVPIADRAEPITSESILFGPTLCTFHTPVSCCDVAVLQDGRLLLAAALQGLKEYSETGQELGCWIPRPTDGRADDAVSAVAALHDGRAAVGLHYARTIVLLKRSQLAGDGGMACWEDERHFATLRSPPRHLSAHGYLVAVTEYRSGGLLLPGSTLTLVSLGNGLVTRQRREYDIESVAVTETSLITASSRAVKIEGSSADRRGGAAAVVDAFTHRGDRRLWRYEAGSCEELVRDVCWASSALFFAVWSWTDGCNGSGGSHSPGGVYRIATVCVEDGRVLQRSSEKHSLRQPDRLSAALVGQRTVIAVLCRGTVMIYAGSPGGGGGSAGSRKVSTADA